MNVLTAWRDSFTLFKPKNLKLFMLVTLKATLETGKTWLKYFWWIPVLQYGLKIFGFIDMQAQSTDSLGMFIFNLLAVTTILLAARPSGALKNCAYYRSYIWRIIYIAPVHTMMLYVMSFLIKTMLGNPADAQFGLNSILLFVLCFFISLFLTYFEMNYSLFVLDSDGSVKHALKSLGWAARMSLYNYPGYLLLASLLFIIMIVGGIILGLFMLSFMKIYMTLYSVEPAGLALRMQPLSPVFLAIFAPFAVLGQLFWYSLIANLYVKKLHDQSMLYFGKND